MIFRAHLEARSMSFEFAALRPMLPARKARLASIMVGLRPSLASSREDEKLARAATSTCQFGSLVDTNLLFYHVSDVYRNTWRYQSTP